MVQSFGMGEGKGGGGCDASLFFASGVRLGEMGVG